MKLDTDFIDTLDFNRHDFGQYQLTLLTGESGSGKSTAIEYLINSNRDKQVFRYLDVAVLECRDSIGQYYPVAEQNLVLVVDEVWSLAHIKQLRDWVKAGYRFVVASHAHAFLSRALLITTRSKLFNLDACQHKLPCYLSAKGIGFTSQSLKQYRQLYGNVFTELQIILEHYPDSHFDEAFNRFHKFNQIDRAPLPWS
jgi:hypothetical protein